MHDFWLFVGNCIGAGILLWVVMMLAPRGGGERGRNER